MMSHEEIEQRAAEFLMRRGEPDWSAQQQAELDAWLSASLAHKAAFWRLEHGWAAIDRLAAVTSLSPGVQASPAWGRWRKPAALAACVVLAVAAGIYRSLDSAPVQARYETLLGARLAVPLPDGSQAQLNTASTLRTEVDARHRWVWLDRGEVYFSVAHDASKPFVIHAGPRRITVLGTKFAVRREADAITVSVVEGRVRLDSENPTSAAGSVTVEKGGIAVADARSTVLAAQPVETIERRLTWRQGVLNFDQSTLGDVAAEFNRYNQHKLIVSDPDVAAMRIGGSFQTTNIEAFIRLLRDAYGLRTQDTGDSTILSR